MTDTAAACAFCRRTMPTDQMVEIPNSRLHDGEPRYVCAVSLVECQRLTRERTEAMRQDRELRRSWTRRGLA